jgi:hypothetical protein
VVVKAELVKGPDPCVGPRSTRAGVVVGVVDVDVEEVFDVVDVEELEVCFVVVDVEVAEFPEVVVVVAPVAAPAAVVVVVLDPPAGGSVYAFEPLEPVDALAPTLW